MKARLAASVVLALAVALGTAGCSLIAPQATLEQYNPSDGVSGETGGVAIRNALLVTEEGTDATLVAGLVSTDGEPHTVNVQYENSEGKQNLEITVRPRGLIGLSLNDLEPKVLRGIDAAPGSLFPVYFQTGDASGVQLRLPVLDTQLAYYSTLAPTPAPTPTATAPAPTAETPSGAPTATTAP